MKNAVGVADPRLVEAGVADLPLLYGNVKKKKVKSPNRNPVFQKTRSQREKRLQKKKVKRTAGVADPRLVEAGVADLPPGVGREPEGPRVRQKTGPGNHRKTKKGLRRNRKINRVPLNLPEEISL